MKLYAALAATACSLLCSCASFDGRGRPESAGFENLLESVVKIDVWEKSHKDGGSLTVRGIGSGVIMDADGTILTNAHVVNCYATKIVVTLANLERVRADFIGWDHWTDLALIRLDMEEVRRRGLGFSHAEFGNSADLKSGEVVYAVGTPHGFARTVTRGIISNASRYFEGTILNSGYETGNFNTWLQTDAAINPGNSGGPLALPDGKVVGVNTRAYANSNNLGFAVPSNVARDVLAALSKNSSVPRGYIGITPAPLQDMEQFFDVATNRGVLVQNVDAGSPAADAGIVPGDIILKINSESVDGRFPEQLPAIMNRIASAPVGKKIALEILRGGKILEKYPVCERLESRVGREFSLEKWGAGMQEITTVFKREAKIKCDSNLMVVGMRRGFPFDLAKIEAGDIILSVNRKKITDAKELEKIYSELSESGSKILVEVQRDSAISFHIVNPGTPFAPKPEAKSPQRKTTNQAQGLPLP